MEHFDHYPVALARWISVRLQNNEKTMEHSDDWIMIALIELLLCKVLKDRS